MLVKRAANTPDCLVLTTPWRHITVSPVSIVSLSISFKLRPECVFYYGSLKWPAIYQPIVPWTPMRALGSESDYPSAKEMATANKELRVPDLRIHSKTNPASQSYSSLAGSGGWWWFFLWFERFPWISYVRVVNSPVCLDQSESQGEIWCCCSAMRWMFSVRDLFICFLISQTFLMSQTLKTFNLKPVW